MKAELVSDARDTAETDARDRYQKHKPMEAKIGSGRILVEKPWAPATGANCETYAPYARNS